MANEINREILLGRSSDYERANLNLKELLDARDAKAAQGNWVPACGGTETPFTTRTGYRLLYCWQPSTGRHAYIDLGTDMVLSTDEANNALALW